MTYSFRRHRAWSFACLLAASCFEQSADPAIPAAQDAGTRDGSTLAAPDAAPPLTIDGGGGSDSGSSDAGSSDASGSGNDGADRELAAPPAGSVLCSKRWPFRSEELPRPPDTGTILPGCCGPSYQGPVELLNGQVVASDVQGRILLTGVYTQAVDLGTGALPIQDPSAQFSEGGAFVVELDPSCTPVWSKGLLDLAGGYFVAFDPLLDRVHVGGPGRENSTLLATLQGAGTSSTTSSAQNAISGWRSPWAISASGAVTVHATAKDSQPVFAPATSHSLNVTFAPSGAIERGAPSADSNVPGTFELMLAPDGSLSWIGASDTPLVVDGKTIGGAGMFDYLASLDAAGHLAWYKTLRESIEVGNSSSILRVARDKSGNTYALDLLSGPLGASFVYDLLLRKFDPAGQLLWETRGSYASESVGYAWLLVDDTRGNVALAFSDTTSVTIGATVTPSSSDTLVVQLDAEGTFAWSHEVPNTTLAGWTFNARGELVIAGKSASPPESLNYELGVTKLAP